MSFRRLITRFGKSVPRLVLLSLTFYLTFSYLRPESKAVEKEIITPQTTVSTSEFHPKPLKKVFHHQVPAVDDLPKRPKNLASDTDSFQASPHEVCSVEKFYIDPYSKYKLIHVHESMNALGITHTHDITKLERERERVNEFNPPH